MEAEETFSIQKDRFGGVNMDTTKIDLNTDESFSKKLKASMAKWREEGVRGLWIKVAKQHSSVIPICVQEGFEFHHAQPGYVMMKTWLPTIEEDMLPEYANQYMGCAGFVVNDQNQVLLIKEKYHGGHKKWKLPGGHANAGEEVGEAAVREVLEETGVQADFECVLALRHQHDYRYGCSDWYFVCLLRARTTAISACSREIADSCWMHVDEYVKHVDISDANRYFAERYQAYVSGGTGCLRPDKVWSYNRRTQHLVYSVHPPQDPQQDGKGD